MLVVVCGLPGVGKTTVAEDVASRVDGELLRTDVIRKDILPDPEYTDEEERMVYRELFERARDTVENGGRVVLDGTFQNEGYRERARVLADSLGVEFRLVKVECAVNVVEQRIESREGDESDADFAVHEMYRELFDPLSSEHVTVDNSDGLDACYRQVEAHFGEDERSVRAGSS